MKEINNRQRFAAPNHPPPLTRCWAVRRHYGLAGLSGRTGISDVEGNKLMEGASGGDEAGSVPPELSLSERNSGSFQHENSKRDYNHCLLFTGMCRVIFEVGRYPPTLLGGKHVDRTYILMSRKSNELELEYEGKFSHCQQDYNSTFKKLGGPEFRRPLFDST
ncbi:hypothetical protein EVAR_31781_1 [Eumeta japonica]|uniref:Uncharacterized protein n=1 Tax=Eumeta variegata TaxID=151549 RepID=A0A4C1W6W4_EUMVA|nr:hypothetical protein EVAR_31781_1 [Eumeta japonica]